MFGYFCGGVLSFIGRWHISIVPMAIATTTPSLSICMSLSATQITHLILDRIRLTTSSMLDKDCSVGNRLLMYSTALKSGLSSASELGST